MGIAASSAVDGEADAIVSIASTASTSVQPLPPADTGKGARMTAAETRSAMFSEGYCSGSAASRSASFGASARTLSASVLTTANPGHLRRHQGHELHVGVERQVGHVDDRASDMGGVNRRFCRHLAVGLQDA